MFSGLTNQVSSWMGKKNEEETHTKEDGNVPEETQATSEPQQDTETKKDLRKGGLEMLGSVKSTMSGWLGGGKVTSPTAEPKPAKVPSVESPPKEQPSNEDDDASSATGGADSDAQLSDNSPTEENQPSQIGHVSTKAIAGAKTFGSLIYSGFSKATKTVTEASAKIKKTVEETSILGELNKEQEAFIKENENKSGGNAAVPPWVGRPNEEAIKAECLSLSTDKRNFVRAPPQGVDFPFDFDQVYPVALATLAVDPNLEKMRFELVPKLIKEENFWRNYFYRVSLICQANEVSSMAEEGNLAEPNRAEEEWEKELEAELGNYEMISNEPTDKNLEVQIDNMLDSSDIDDLK